LHYLFGGLSAETTENNANKPQQIEKELSTANHFLFFLIAVVSRRVSEGSSKKALARFKPVAIAIPSPAPCSNNSLAISTALFRIATG
jgi:hypothetical protein